MLGNIATPHHIHCGRRSIRAFQTAVDTAGPATKEVNGKTLTVVLSQAATGTGSTDIRSRQASNPPCKAAASISSPDSCRATRALVASSVQVQ